MSRKAVEAAARNMDPGKAARVEQERTRLMELFAGADPNRLDFVRDHVQQLAWLGITIVELQAQIDEYGPILPFKNGTQEGWQANPACKTLKDLQTLFNAAFRALLPVLPERPSTSELDLLRMEFAPAPMTAEEIAAAEQAEIEKRKRIDEEIAAAQKKLDEMHAKHGH